MKIRYALYMFFLAMFVSYWFVDARYSNGTNDYADYIADHYMPLVRTMDTFEEIVNGKKNYNLVVAYVYRLTAADQKAIGTSDGQPVHSVVYNTVNDAYDTIQSYVETENDRFDAAGPRGVKFIGVNLFHGNMDELPAKYKLGREPLLLFFRDGELVAQQPAGRNVTRQTIKNFLQGAKFFDFLDDETQRYQTNEAREVRRERQLRRRYYSQPYFGWSYGYPYRYYYGGPGSYWGPGYYGYYRRPYGGFYIGW